MRPKTSFRVVRVSLLAATCIALFFTASTRVSGTGGLPLIATSTIAKAGDNVVGTAVTSVGSALFYSAFWHPNNPVDDGEALVGQFTAPFATSVPPTWQQQWPDGDPLAPHGF